MTDPRPSTIDGYIAGFPEDVQQALREVRAAIKRAAPEAGEAIKYAIPTFVLKGNLVHFAAHKNHIGLYPTPSGLAAFEKELSGFKSGKGSARFPLDKPMPIELIEKIAAFRLAEMAAKGKKK